MDEFQRYLLLLTAAWTSVNLAAWTSVNLVYFRVHGAKVSTFDVTGRLVDDFLSLKCGFRPHPGDTVRKLTIRRKRRTENEFSDVAEFHFNEIRSYVYLDNCLKRRTTLKQSNDSASIIFNELHRSDDGTYQCDLFYYNVNNNGNRSMETMILSVRDPSAARVRIDESGVVWLSDDASQAKRQAHMPSMGKGIGIGIFIMLLVVTGCLVMVYVFREKAVLFLSVINNYLGKRDKGQKPNADVRVNQGIEACPRPENIYEEPDERVNYEHLQAETRQSSAYDKIRTSYFNV